MELFSPVPAEDRGVWSAEGLGSGGGGGGGQHWSASLLQHVAGTCLQVESPLVSESSSTCSWDMSVGLHWSASLAQHVAGPHVCMMCSAV